MLFDIYVICFLFVIGLFVGEVAIIIGLKGPLRTKDYANCCDNCNHPYKWYELIPVISYFLNRTTCPYCKKDLSLVYPSMELLTGLLFSFSYMLYGFSYEMIVMILITILSCIIYISDFKYFIILDKPLAIVSLLILIFKYVFFGLETFIISLCSGFLIFIFMMIVRYIGNRMFKQECLGGGDIKLSVLFGFMLGIKLSIVSLIIGSFLAFPYAIYAALSNEKKEIPFGPFLITGLYLVFVFMDPIRNFLSIIFK